MVTEEPDKFKEVMEEIFDIKIELIQAFSDLGKKFDNLINARSFFQSEPGMTVPQDYDPLQTPKKESTKKGAGPQDQKIITERKTKVKEKVINKDKMNALDVESYEVIKKSYLIKDHGQKAFIGQSLVKSIEKTKEGFVLYFTEAAQIWFTYDKINWEEDT